MPAIAPDGVIPRQHHPLNGHVAVVNEQSTTKPAAPPPDPWSLKLVPPLPPLAWPSAIVRSAKWTANAVAGGPLVAPGAPGLMKNTREALLPLIVS